MIDYAWPTVFLGTAVQKDLLITDGTVTVSGDTYAVTDDTVTITNSDLEAESFDLRQSLCSDMQLRFGSCEAASISFVFHGDTASIKGKTVKVYIIPNHEASKMLQLGVFTINEEKKVGDAITKRQCTGYDAMYDILNADVAEWYYGLFTSSTTTKTIKQVRDSFLSNFSITPETVTLINDTVNIRRTIEADSISGADIIRGICEVNGVFGMITNEGKFRFVSLTPDVDDDATDIDTTDLISCQFESYNSKAITGVKIVFSTGASKVYGLPINRYTISGNVIVNSISDSPATLYNAGQRLYNKVKGHLYTPATITALGNPVYEVGDPIRATARGDREILTYILERRLSGIQALRDTYSAKGEEKCSAALNSSASRYTQMGNEIAQSTAQAIAKSDSNFVEIIRNIGFRLLDEPSGVTAEYDEINNEVSLKWTDPSDIDTNEPCPATWSGTVVVRNEYHAPLHRWDGTLIVNSTTRDEYSVNALVDNTVQQGHGYYYGLFPYDIKGDYRYTKVVQIGASEIPAPQIDSLTVSNHTSIIVDYAVDSSFTWSYITLVYKKNSAPASKTDGTTVSLNASDTSKTITGLDEESTYYFKIFAQVTGSSVELESNTENATTGIVPDLIVQGAANEIIIVKNTEKGTRYDNVTDESWHTFTKTFDEPVYVDYVELYGIIGIPQVKDIKLTINGVVTPLEDLLKTSDISHCQTAVAWNFRSLSQYFNTDYNLALLSMENSRLPQKSGDVYYFENRGTACDSYYDFKLKDTYLVSAFTMTGKVQFDGYNNNAVFGVRLRRTRA